MDATRKRLLFRAHHMGTNENDTFFGSFAEEHLAVLSEAQLAEFEALLAVNDPDLFSWVSGAKAVPPGFDTEMMRMLQRHIVSKTKP